MDKIRQWLYYFVIGVVSLIALVFLPMVGSEVGMDWNLPTTTIGWIVWVTVKLIVAAINVLLFHCFMQQAKLNVAENEKYKKANDLIVKVAPKIYTPRSPKEFNRKEYSVKGVTIFITTALSTVALTQALLSFDYMSLLTYLFTIIFGVILGILQMKKAETYWINEYYDYAIKFYEEHKEELENGNNNRQCDLQESGGTSREEQTGHSTTLPS